MHTLLMQYTQYTKKTFTKLVLPILLCSMKITALERVFFPSARKIVQNILQNREGFEQK